MWIPIRAITLAVAAGAAMSQVCQAAGAERKYFVSPDGSDAGPGTRVRPFATIEKARDAVRRTNGNMSGDIVVTLRGGTYRLEETLRFDGRDSGTNGHEVIYLAYPGERPIVSGGRTIEGWVEDTGGRWKARTDVRGFRQLYVNGTRAARARGGPLPGAEAWGDWDDIRGVAGYRTSDATMADWRNPSDIEFGYYVSWSHKIARVRAIARDPAGGAVVTMQQPCFFLSTRIEGTQAGVPDYIENALELLDEPGEWYLDRPGHTVYYIPRAGEDLRVAEVIAPAVETLLEVRGTLERPARDIRFEGITFAHGAWLRPGEDGHPDVQANFIASPEDLFQRGGVWTNVQNESLKSPANIVLDAARSIRFERCTFTQLGGAGLDIQHGSRDNVVSGCRFFDISGSGIQVGDVLKADHHPDDPRLVVKDNRIVNSLIRNVGVDYEDSIGIFCGYTRGTVIAHNEIAQLPYSGISVGWGWGEPDVGGGNYESPVVYDTPTPLGDNRIEYNHIYDVMLRRNDGGGIYMLSNQPGTIIRGNHVHDNPGAPGGIYLDEGSGFIEITGNLVYSVPTPNVNYNNRAQDRIKTIDEHDNWLGVAPDAEGVPPSLVEEAGLQEGYRDLLE